MIDVTQLPEQLKEIVEDFSLADGQEKLELLLQYSESLPPIPENKKQSQDEMEQVPECMTPVFIQSESDGEKMHFYFEVPPESPTVRGFAAILAFGLNGLTPEEILQVPNEFYQTLGLESLLSYQRMHGFSGILAHIKRLAAAELNGQFLDKSP